MSLEELNLLILAYTIHDIIRKNKMVICTKITSLNCIESPELCFFHKGIPCHTESGRVFDMFDILESVLADIVVSGCVRSILLRRFVRHMLCRNRRSGQFSGGIIRDCFC